MTTGTRATEIIGTLMGRPLVDDPMPLYHELRSIAPVHREDNGVWYLSRYDDCERVLRSPRFLNAHGEHGDAASSPRRRLTARMFSYDDPPAHTEKRAMVSSPFTVAACARLAEHTHDLASKLVVSSVQDDLLDLDELAIRLPVVMTCELLGIPPDDRDRCVAWVDAMTSTNQPVAVVDLEAAADQAATEAISYFAGLLAERRATPAHDLISHVAAVSPEHPSMSTEDLVATIVLLMAAGFETTRYTIVGGLIALADDGAQLARAREQIDESGALSNDAVEELLRHQGPIHGALPRRSREDESFGDLSVPAGEHVVVMAAAANRDPARYTDPDRLDLDRNEARPLSFGHGPHYCLGANLAKLEINAAVTAVLRLAPEVSCAHRPSPKGSFNVRGPRGAVLGVG